MGIKYFSKDEMFTSMCGHDKVSMDIDRIVWTYC